MLGLTVMLITISCQTNITCMLQIGAEFWIISHTCSANRSHYQRPQGTRHISHNAPLWNRNVHISVPKWCIVGYGRGALWNLWDWSNTSAHYWCCLSMTWLDTAFHITVPLWGESTYDWWISHTKGQMIQNLVFSLLLAWTNCWTNEWVVGHLRCLNTHVTSL